MTKTNNRRAFSKQFKLDVINQSEHCHKITELAQDLGLRAELIYRWRSEVKAHPEQSFPGNGNQIQTPEQEKIAHLERQLADVRMQRDILKKAMGIFTNPNK